MKLVLEGYLIPWHDYFENFYIRATPSLAFKCFCKIPLENLELFKIFRNNIKEIIVPICPCKKGRNRFLRQLLDSLRVPEPIL